METIHLQGIGKVPAKKASELVPGDRLCWNYSHGEYEVVSAAVVGKMVQIVEKRIATGETFTRKKKPDTLVGVVNKIS